jgi:hypothetical protein
MAIHKFEIDFGVPILRRTPLAAPPTSPAIPLMWAQEAYSLRLSPGRRDVGGTSLFVKFATVRQLRSAASHFFSWDTLVARPGAAILDEKKRVLHLQCRPTDDLASSLFAAGLGARLGEEAVPSVALLDRHVRARWATRARCYAYNGPATKIFCHANGTAWTSRYFREKYLYPSLRSQQAAGDALLRAFDSLSGPNSIPAKFWSLHCYRRGARTQVTRGGGVAAHRFRKATTDQVYEHGRWERKRSGERIDVIYREWTTRDRVKITFYCQ